MDTIFTILLFILCVLVSVQIIYSYFTFSSFSCPACPDCPAVNLDGKAPSNDNLRLYIVSKFIDVIDEDLNTINYIKDNVIFSDNYLINYQQDAQNFIEKIKNDLITNKSNISTINLKYVQFIEQENITKFMLKYNLSKFPSPLIYFKGSNLLFGFIDNEWKILIDVSKI